MAGQDGKDEKTAPTEAVEYTIDGGQEAKTEILANIAAATWLVAGAKENPIPAQIISDSAV
jgi:hypothetical protein